MPDLRFHVKVGDIVRVQDCHHLRPHFYEVSSVDSSGVYSEPAHFLHWYSDITAIYRLYGDELRCYWIKR